MNNFGKPTDISFTTNPLSVFSGTIFSARSGCSYIADTWLDRMSRNSRRICRLHRSTSLANLV